MHSTARCTRSLSRASGWVLSGSVLLLTGLSLGPQPASASPVHRGLGWTAGGAPHAAALGVRTKPYGPDAKPGSTGRAAGSPEHDAPGSSSSTHHRSDAAGPPRTTGRQGHESDPERLPGRHSTQEAVTVQRPRTAQLTTGQPTAVQQNKDEGDRSRKDSLAAAAGSGRRTALQPGVTVQPVVTGPTGPAAVPAQPVRGGHANPVSPTSPRTGGTASPTGGSRAGAGSSFAHASLGPSRSAPRPSAASGPPVVEPPFDSALEVPVRKAVHDVLSGALRHPELPLSLLAVVAVFLLVQNRIDRRDPKLTAPLTAEPDLGFGPAVRGALGGQTA